MENNIKQILDSEQIMSAQQFKQIRDHIGFSQEQLAFKLGYEHKSAVSHLETGRNKITVPIDYMIKSLARGKSDV